MMSSRQSSGEEPRPTRPGSETGQSLPRAEETPGSASLLSQDVAGVIAAVERLWGQIDPRCEGLDRYQAHVGRSPETLSLFFERAVMFLSVLEGMFEELDLIDERQDINSAGHRRPPDQMPLAAFRELAVKAEAVTSAHDRLVAKVIEVLCQAGIEADEADVDSWDATQRNQAVKWAISEKQRMNQGKSCGEVPPDFLTKDDYRDAEQ